MNAQAPRPRVLLAEDRPSLLTQGVRLLSNGFVVTQGLPGDKGLAKAVETFKPQWVVSNITLPGVNGLELTRQTPVTPNGPRVVMLTVHARPDYVQTALRTAASGYVLESRLASDLLPASPSAVANQRFVSDGIDPTSVHGEKNSRDSRFAVYSTQTNNPTTRPYL